MKWLTTRGKIEDAEEMGKYLRAILDGSDRQYQCWKIVYKDEYAINPKRAMKEWASIHQIIR